MVGGSNESGFENEGSKLEIYIRQGGKGKGRERERKWRKSIN